MSTGTVGSITKGVILGLSSNADVYARGERYYRDGKLLSIKTNELPDMTLVRASVEGNYKNYVVNLRLDANGQVRGYRCNCESHSIWRGACKHVVAVLFALMEGVAVDDGVSAAMRKVARTLTDNIERMIFEEIDSQLEETEASAQPVRLTPCFHYDGTDTVYLTFTVGYTRMYVVKNISAFLNSIKNEETVGYGAGLKFCHTPSLFDEPSRRLIAFLQDEENIFAEMTKRINRQYYYSYNSRDNVRTMPLSSRNFDAFFDLYAGKSIDGVINGPVTLRLQAHPPDIALQIQSDDQKTAVSASPFNLRAFNGRRFHYFIATDAIYRMDKQNAQILLQLVRSLSEANSKSIILTESDRDRFLSTILPRIQKMGIQAQITGDMTVRQVATLKTHLYFDADGRDIVCRVAFLYNDTPIDANNPPRDLLRDTVGEYTVKRALTLYGFTLDATKDQYRLTGNDAIYNFLDGDPPGVDSLRQSADIFVTDALRARTIRPVSTAVGIRLHGDLLNVSLDDCEFTLAELMEAMESYQAKKKYHRLKDGRFLSLDNESVQSTADLIASLDVTKKDIQNGMISLPAYRALYLDGLAKQRDSTLEVRRNEQFERLIHHFQDLSELGFEPPESLASVLREYQKTGFQWLKVLAHYGFGGILADDMGLGKTLQVIAVLLLDQKPGAQSLVVAPTSLLFNWENEIKKFAPQLSTAVVTGVPAKRQEILQNKDADVFITTYDTMKRDIAFYEDKRFAYLIADEAQNIKNPATQNAKAIKEIRAGIKYALTGTPIENTLTELWSIFDFIMPGYLHTAHKFGRLYEQPIIKDNNQEQAARLRQLIAPFVMRRIKRNVLTELPDKTETTLVSELLPEQRKIYLANLLKARGELDHTLDGASGNRIKILAQLTRLRQICCHPSLFVEHYRGGSGKLDLTLETIQMTIESGHRILLFSQFTSMLAILQRALDERGIAYFYLEGATSAQNRTDMTQRFNNGERDVFLISLKAGGTGLNLTGADVVIHYDPWWNPSVMDQASDRAHRYGQEKAVQIFNIVAKDTIEEKIIALQEKKRDLIDSVITEGGSFINALTEDEIRALFATT